jgi:hypothetical protein
MDFHHKESSFYLKILNLIEISKKFQNICGKLFYQALCRCRKQTSNQASSITAPSLSGLPL